MRVNAKYKWLCLTIAISLMWIFFASSLVIAKKKVPLKVLLMGSPAEDITDPITGEKLLGWHHVWDKFNKEHPNIKLEVITVPWGARISPRAKALMELQDNEFDVVLGALRFIYSGLYESLNYYVERDNYNLDKLWDHVLCWAKLPGDKERQLYGIGYVAGAPLIAYDKKIFDDYGVPYLSTIPTLDEWVTKAKRLSGVNPRTGEKTYGYWIGSFHMEFMYQSIVRCLGGNYCTEDTKYPTLTTEECVKATQILVDMAKAGVFRPDYMSAGVPAGWLTKKNTIAMYGEPSAANIVLKVPFTDRSVDEFGISTWPVNPFGHAGWLPGGDTPLGINTHSDHKDEAWEFVKFWNTKEVQAFAFRSPERYQSRCPTLKDWGEWDIPTVHKLKEAGYMDTVMKSIAMSDPLGGNTPRMFSVARPIIRSELQAAMAGKISAKEACETMQAQIMERLY